MKNCDSRCILLVWAYIHDIDQNEIVIGCGVVFSTFD